MNKLLVITALALIFIIVFAYLLVIQYRRDRDRQKPPTGDSCSDDGPKITSFYADNWEFKGQIAPTRVYAAETSFLVETSKDFQNGGVLMFTEYPNEEENGVVTGLSIVDIESGNVNVTTPVSCALGWDMDGGPNSATCRTTSNVKGWNVTGSPVSSWKHANGIQHILTLASPAENKYSISWEPVPGADVYAVSVTLVGESYNSNDVAVPTRLAFGGLTSKNSMQVTTGGSTYFTADIPSVESVKVVGFNHCDLGNLNTTCLGHEISN